MNSSIPTIKKLKGKGIDGTDTLSSGLGNGFSTKSVAEVEEELRPKSAEELAVSVAEKAEKAVGKDTSSKAAEIRARAALVRAKAKKLKSLEGATEDDINHMESEFPKKKK